MRKKSLFLMAVLAGAIPLVLGTACGQADRSAQAVVAKAELQAVADSGVSGMVTFTEVSGGVSVEAHVNGLTPGKHGFHIHEWGDCSSADGKSAGGHFNPEGVSHGGPQGRVAHAGDLGNLEADPSGHGMLNLVNPRITLGEGAQSVLGRAVIVHQGQDDLKTQPTGAAGARVACGVILREGDGTPRVLPR
jgi:Cu-Zn family superoxide dismutase